MIHGIMPIHGVGVLVLAAEAVPVAAAARRIQVEQAFLQPARHHP